MHTLRIFFALLLFSSANLLAGSSSSRLSANQIRQTFAGNTFTGRFSDSTKRYAIYFTNDGRVYLQKEGQNQFVYYGQWKTENNLLVTPWPYRDLEVQQKHKMNFYKSRDLIIYKLVIYNLGEDVYEPYRPRLCGCDPSPPKTFPNCTLHKGRVLLDGTN